jgi:hypothetical protein
MEWLPRFGGGCGPGPRQRTVRGLLGRGCLPGLSDMCGEAPVFIERTNVGLDVHARSVVAHAMDGVTGEVFMGSHHNRRCSWRLNPPVSSSDLAM